MNDGKLTELEQAVFKVAEAYASKEKASDIGIAKVYETVFMKALEMRQKLKDQNSQA